MSASSEKVENHYLSGILDREGKDLMMDFRGPVNESYEVAPSYAYRTAKKLDDVYESALSEPWDLDYTLDQDSVFVELEKRYDEVSEFAESRQVTIDPSNIVFVSPVEDKGLEVEIRGVMDIDPQEFLMLVD